MSIYALIKNNTIITTLTWDGKMPYNPDGDLYDITDRPEIDINWGFENGEFIPPEYDDLPIDVIDSAHVRNDTARIDELEAQVAQLLKLLEGKS